jgi:Fe-S-cluster containining protein
MKRALNLSSGEFLEKYTVVPYLEEQKLPLVFLKMMDDSNKTCPLVTANGCSIYEDRPWSCRMYPLGSASSKTADQPDGMEFHFVVEDGFSCLGLKEDKEWTVAEWRKNQGIDLYDHKSEPYKEITLHRLFREGKTIGPSKTQMFYIACYDIDRFRGLVFESSFFNRFDISKELVKKIRTDDEALLDFGFKWLKFGLFGENTVKIKAEVLEEKKKDLFKNEESS